MIVSCDDCKVQMDCIEKTQDEALAATKSTYVCGGCHHRVVVNRRGVRKEDPGRDRPNAVTEALGRGGPSDG